MPPAVYSLFFDQIIGELGERTEAKHFPECPACDRRIPTQFPRIDYCFDRWAGEDLVTAMGCYAVSERLRRALEQAGVSGAAFEEMTVSLGDYFEITGEAYAESLPPFYRLVITGQASGPETWWQSWVCEKCGLKHWEITKLGIKATAADLMGEIGPPREVFADSWQGHDLFYLGERRDPPLVTQRFVDVLQQVNSSGVVFHPAKWI